jgi:deoxyribonuclease (pyrimidine dimer)
MTRINIGINPKILSNKHLIAEHREIKRIPNSIKSGKAIIKNIPNKFTLGVGHVKFFYDKLGYLHNRYLSLYNECIARGFSVASYEESFNDLPKYLYKNYNPTSEDISIIIERLIERDSKYELINFE